MIWEKENNAYDQSLTFSLLGELLRLSILFIAADRRVKPRIGRDSTLIHETEWLYSFLYSIQAGMNVRPVDLVAVWKALQCAPIFNFGFEPEILIPQVFYGTRVVQQISVQME